MTTTRTFVYAIGTENGPIKVGITTSLFSRLQSLQTGSSRKLELIWVYTTYDREEARIMERNFHEVHAEQRLAGEWFDMDADLVCESLETSVHFQFGPFAKEFFAARYARLKARGEVE